MDLYTILGLTPVATLAEVKRAYKRLARRYHPDINPGDGTAVARFRQITEAYETLSDPDRRRSYDVSGGQVPDAAGRVSYEFQGFDFSMNVAGFQAPTFGELFAEVFGASGLPQTREPERGVDLHAAMSLSFLEAVQGVERRVSVTRRVACRACEGRGVVRTAESRCRSCHGAGAVRSTRGHMVFSRSCPACGGTGHQEQFLCTVCRGECLEARVDGIAVHVPAGVDDGARIRVAEQGNAGRFGGPFGDLHVAVRVAPHELFRREGDDLSLVVPLAIHEAALGARIEVPSLEGPVRVRVPPGTQSGQRFRLRERGVRSVRDGRRGDLVVEVRLTLPKVLDERSKALLREFAQANPEDLRADLVNAK